jgi:ribonuclease P protein component
MPRVSSLSKRGDIGRVVRFGKRTEVSGLSIRCLDSDAPGVRLVMAVRASGAVTRNRVRRRLRAAVAAAELRDGTDLMIRADGSAAELKFQEMVDGVRGAAL